MAGGNSAEDPGDRGGCQSVHFNSTGNWSRDAGYNRAEYNIYNLPELSDFDGIILELNNISSPAVLADVISNAKRSGRPVVSIANELGDFIMWGSIIIRP